MSRPSFVRPDLRLRLVENKAETLSIAIRRRGEIFLKLSRASNNRCRFCNDAGFQDGTFWPYDALTAMIDEGIAQGVKRVFLSGGEPTLHPQFLKVIAYARRRGAEQIICITNGRLFAYDELSDKAVRLGLTEAFVAVLGSNASTHDALSQVAGSFEQTTRGVRNLLARGVRVHLSTVANRQNLDELADILALLPGVTGLTAVRIAPAGRALWESLDDLGFETAEARGHVERAFRRADELGIEFRPKLFPIGFYEGREGAYTHHEEYLPEIKDSELRTGLFGAFARGEGDVPCRGATCRVCFRQPFCDALYAFRERLLGDRHTVVRCDLDDERQRALLPALHRERKLWLRVRRAADVEPLLRASGLAAATGEGEAPRAAVTPWVVEADELGGGDAPRCEHLLLPADAAVGRAERLARARWVGLVPVGEVGPDPALAGAARFAFVASHERYRDELARGVAGPALATRTNLPVAGLPPCLAARQHTLVEPDELLDLGAVLGPSTVDVVGFTHHFLARLHRDKSARCDGCVETARCPGLHVNHARRWGLSLLAPISATTTAQGQARPEDHRDNFARRAERFRTLAGEQRFARAALPSDLAELVAARARELEPALRCIDVPGREQFAARARRGAEAAFAQTRAGGVKAYAAALVASARRIARGRLLHGTGSWAFQRILEDGALVPGGDGLTGEVALTHVRSSDLYVCLGGPPESLYAAAAFAFANCGDDGAALELSVVRAGGRPVSELFSVLAFGEGDARFSEATRRQAQELVRHRTLEMDRTLAQACARALELARSGALAGDGSTHTRRIGGPNDHEIALGNVLSAAVEHIEGDAAVMRLPPRERLAAAVLRHMPALERELTCPLPDDDDERRARKLTLLATLQKQFPCVLELEPREVELREGPTYGYSPERLVGHRIAATAITHVHVPRGEMAGVATKLGAHGLAAEVVALEELEAVRLCAESVAGDVEAR